MQILLFTTEDTDPGSTNFGSRKLQIKSVQLNMILKELKWDRSTF